MFFMWHSISYILTFNCLFKLSLSSIIYLIVASVLACWGLALLICGFVIICKKMEFHVNVISWNKQQLFLMLVLELFLTAQMSSLCHPAGKNKELGHLQARVKFLTSFEVHFQLAIFVIKMSKQKFYLLFWASFNSVFYQLKYLIKRWVVLDYIVY